jgi:hypothetical protein
VILLLMVEWLLREWKQSACGKAGMCKNSAPEQDHQRLILCVRP